MQAMGKPTKDDTETDLTVLNKEQAKPRLRRVNPKIAHYPRSDPKKLLEYIFETLCSLRNTAKTFDHKFLAYLIEMAALEAEAELNEAQKSPTEA